MIKVLTITKETRWINPLYIIEMKIEEHSNGTKSTALKISRINGYYILNVLQIPEEILNLIRSIDKM